MNAEKLFLLLWKRDATAHSLEDTMAKRVATIILALLAFLVLVNGSTLLVRPNALISVSIYATLCLTTQYAIWRGWGVWWRPVSVLLFFVTIYGYRVSVATPFSTADVSLVMLLFINLLAPFLLIERRLLWLQLTLGAAILLAILYLETAIAQFGFIQQAAPTATMQTARWISAGVVLVSVFVLFNRELRLAEARNDILLQQAAEQNQLLTSQAATLKALQEAHVRDEKLKTMDRIFARVSHQINSPLGALHSTVQMNGELAIHILSQLAAEAAPVVVHTRLAILREYVHLIQQQMVELQGRGLSYRNKQLLSQQVLAQLHAKYGTNQYSLEELHDWAHHLCELQLPMPVADIFLSDEARPHLPLLGLIASWLRNYRVEQGTTLALLNLSNNLQTAMGSRPYLYSSRKELNAELKVVLNAFYDQHPNANLHVKYPLQPCQHQGAWLALHTILHNLLSNAYDATEGTGLIQLEVVSQPEGIHLQVSDEGLGIAAELQPMLYQPFFTTKERGLSIGLGLYVVRQMLDEQGGTIEYTHTKGLTTFMVHLPWPRVAA